MYRDRGVPVTFFRKILNVDLPLDLKSTTPQRPFFCVHLIGLYNCYKKIFNF